MFRDPKVIAALISAVFGPITLYLLKKFSKLPLKKSLEKDEHVYGIMNDLLERYKADRIELYQFHNGGKFYSGHPRQKLSMTHEAFCDTSHPQMRDFQDIPASYLQGICSNLKDYKDFICPDVEELGERNAMTRKLLKSWDIKSFYAFPIFNRKSNKLISVMFMTFKQQVDLTQGEQNITGIKLKVENIRNIIY